MGARTDRVKEVVPAPSPYKVTLSKVAQKGDTTAKKLFQLHCTTFL